MAKTVYVVQDDCTSCVQCVDNLPEVFQMDDDDLAEVIDPFGAPEEEIQDEIDACPGECIIWKED
ncbi:MAG: ferredoxin [Deltaproteobacteria bacterium]|nr:ferredoxin [Deltaproteobacteria bacterium]